MTNLPELLTPAQVANRYQTTTGVLAQWRHYGIGPAYLKPGGKTGGVFYPLDELIVFERRLIERARSALNHAEHTITNSGVLDREIADLNLTKEN